MCTCFLCLGSDYNDLIGHLSIETMGWYFFRMMPIKSLNVVQIITFWLVFDDLYTRNIQSISYSCFSNNSYNNKGGGAESYGRTRLLYKRNRQIQRHQSLAICVRQQSLINKTFWQVLDELYTWITKVKFTNVAHSIMHLNMMTRKKCHNHYGVKSTKFKRLGLIAGS